MVWVNEANDQGELFRVRSGRNEDCSNGEPTARPRLHVKDYTRAAGTYDASVVA